MPAFPPADPARQARLLGPEDIHVWRFAWPAGTGRAPIRSLLAGYLDVSPDAVRFHEGLHGRPSIAPPHDPLDVNWSHSHGVGTLAIARSLPVLGIDVETPHPRPRALQLSRRFFHPDESRQLARLSPARVEPAFLRLWTAKEAVLKALGEGLRFGLDRIRFRLVDALPVVDRFDEEAGPADAWHVLRMDDATAWTCVAWRGPARRVLGFEPMPGRSGELFPATTVPIHAR